MTNDAEAYIQKIKARNFVQNNGQILRTINILHVNYEKLSDVKFAISNVSEHDFLSSVNYLFVGIHFAPSYQNKRACRHRRCSV